MKLLKKLPLVVAVLFASVTFADNGCEPKEPVKAYDQGYPVKEDQMVGAYNSSARIDVRGSWDIFVTGSFIYYQVLQTGIEPGFELNSTTSAPIKGHLEKMDCDYKPGFKVALGMNFNHDNWDAFVEYTRLHGEHTASHKADAGKVLTTSYDKDNDLSEKATYSKVVTNWEPNLDIIDFNLGRAYYVGTKLTFRPFAAFRAGWIDQEYEQKLFALADGAEVDPHLKANSDSWLVGPKMGLDTNWHFGCGFRFFSNAAASLLYQRSHVKYFDPSAPDSKVKHKDYNDVVPNFMLVMGFAWGSYFDHSNWNFDLSAGYAFEIFFKQNSMRYLKDQLSSSIGAEAGSMVLHGLVVTARLDF